MSKTITLYNGEVTLEFDEGKHAYRWGEKLIPGVTKILSCLDKPALVNWAAGMAADYFASALDGFSGTVSDLDVDGICKRAKSAHRTFSKTATDIGKEVHSFAERALVEQRVTMPTDPQVRAGAEAFMGWLHATDLEPIAVERMVMSRKYNYAGTADYYGKIGGKICVADIKTSGSLYREMLLQIAAYGIALSEEFSIEINDGWIIRCDKQTGLVTPYHIPITDDLRQAFIRVRGVHQSLGKLDDAVKEIKNGKAAA